MNAMLIYAPSGNICAKRIMILCIVRRGFDMNESILHQPEGKTLEFKRDLTSPRNFLKTLVAFANTAGGRLIIGISDDRQVVGIENPLDEEERLSNLIADSIAPRLVPNIELVTAEDKTLLVVEVFLSNTRPHWLKSLDPATGTFVRLGSTNRQADRALISDLHRSVEGIAYDQMPMPELTIDDLDINAAQQAFAGKRNLNEQTLTTLKLLTHCQGKLVPTKGAVLLFGKERTFHFDDAWIQCGRFIGSDKADIFDHIEIYDHLPQAVDSIMLFLKKHAMRGANFSEIRRKDVWSIPLGILREVVINALVHADYSHRGTPFRIAFYDDRIEVESPGILLPGMTIEEMKRGISQIRNPVIARVFKELNLIEQWGSGVPGIFREAGNLGLPEPEIIEIGMRVRFIVPLKQPIPMLSRGAHPKSGVESGVESEMALQVLTFLKTKPLSKSEIAEALGKTKPTRYLNDLMKRLLETNKVGYTIPDKPSSRLQKYRLTDDGKAALDVQ